MCDCCDYIAARGGAPGDPVLTREWERAELARIEQALRKGRWRTLCVEAEPGRPQFGYTIGLSNHGHPEVVVFGLVPAQARPLLDFVGSHVVRGLGLADGDAFEFDSRQVSVFDLPNPQMVTLWAADRDPARISALQLVYADPDGIWPWEPGCSLPVGSQPLPGWFDARH